MNYFNYMNYFVNYEGQRLNVRTYVSITSLTRKKSVKKKKKNVNKKTELALQLEPVRQQVLILAGEDSRILHTILFYSSVLRDTLNH